MIKINTKNISKDKVVYLSGPMTGLADYNREAFNLRADAFERLGYQVKNPAKISEWFGTDKPYVFYLKRALMMLLSCDVMYSFGSWQNSRGCVLERYVADVCGLPVVDENEPEQEPQAVTNGGLFEGVKK